MQQHPKQSYRNNWFIAFDILLLSIKEILNGIPCLDKL